MFSSQVFIVYCANKEHKPRSNTKHCMQSTPSRKRAGKEHYMWEALIVPLNALLEGSQATSVFFCIVTQLDKLPLVQFPPCMDAHFQAWGQISVPKDCAALWCRILLSAAWTDPFLLLSHGTSGKATRIRADKSTWHTPKPKGESVHLEILILSIQTNA